ncbi:MAG: hypothetical protein VKL60_18680 [Sphaerospermopsis sp.]|nr:hypothetical protein [Sphaerospermopsis sp.]
MVTYQKAYFRGVGIGIAIKDVENDFYQFFGKGGMTELASSKQIELFPNSERTAPQSKVEGIIQLHKKYLKVFVFV